MALVTWNDSIAVGIPSLDGQHQRWIGLINDLHDAMMARKGREIVAATLKGMVEYTRTHFGTEERLMTRHGFAEAASHTRLHDEFVARIAEMEARHQAGDATLTIDVMDSLRDWLVRHIQTVDRQYVAHLKAHGVQ